jgi:hypothetical protein
MVKKLKKEQRLKNAKIMKKIIACLLFVNALYCQSWEIKLDTIKEQKLREYIYDSKFEAYRNEINRVKTCNPNDTATLNDLNIFLNNLIQDYESNTNSGSAEELYYNGDIIRHVLHENSKKEILTVFLISFMHPKSDVLQSADYIILVETDDDWNIYNVREEVKNKFKKRVKRGEFLFNFEHLFNTLKTTTEFEMYCFPGRNHILITKIYKQSMHDSFVTFTSKVNIAPTCPEVNFFEYILGFKNHLNPQEYR